MELQVSAKDRRCIMSKIDEMKEEILEFLSETIRIPSVNPDLPGVTKKKVLGGETRCNEYIAQRLKSWGFDVDMWEVFPKRSNLVGVLEGDGGGRSLILNGHIDTVAPGEAEDWKSDPFGGIISKGKVYGRGASDMKGGIVTMISAIRAIREAGYRLKGDVFVESVIGEEMMQPGTLSAVERGYRADAAIVTEPSGMQSPLAVEPVHGGGLWFVITIRGKSTHTGLRYGTVHPSGRGASIGVSAIEKGIKIATSLQNLEREWGIEKKHPLLPPGHTALNLGLFKGGATVGLGEKLLAAIAVPDYCSLEYITYYPPDADVDKIKKEVENYIKAVARTDSWLRKRPPKVEWKLHWPPLTTDPNHPIVKTMAAAHRLVTNRPAVINGFEAVCDATFLKRSGIPTVIYGPGTLGQAHAANEYVDVKELIIAAKSIALAALGWCGYTKA